MRSRSPSEPRQGRHTWFHMNPDKVAHYPFGMQLAA